MEEVNTLEQHTIAFFNSLQLNSENKIKIGDLISECIKKTPEKIVIDPSVPTIPNWIWTLQMTNNFSMESTINKDKFIELGTLFNDLNASEERFLEIDKDNDGLILFSEVVEAYRLPPHRIPQTPLGVIWLNTVKEKENITDEHEISLEELLAYENKYIILHDWPNPNVQ